jgi:PAT family beta-lactamase induction signal transducer AmpG
MSSILSAFTSRRMLSVFMLGFSSGLPFLLIGSTLKAWLKDLNVDLTTIGLFALVGTPYSLKFLWSPFLDRYTLPFLDRRRGWILAMQVALAICMLALSTLQPDQNYSALVAITCAVAFFSATQDIAIDAYRREVLRPEELGLGSSMAVNGYRIGMLLAGAGALTIADQWDWASSYRVMAFAMLSCLVFTLIAPSAEISVQAPKTLKEAVIEPFLEYFKRSGAIEVLIFILLFKVGDQMASDMFTPFYLEIGFTKTEVGLVSKGFGVWASIVGGVAGGILLIRYPLIKCLWLFGALQALSTLGFSWLASVGNNVSGLAGVVFFENLTSGMGTAAFIAFMAGVCNTKFTATQYALLSSFMGVPRIFFGSASGYLAKNMGWSTYFVFCALIAIPGMLMLFRARKWSQPEGQSNEVSTPVD